MEQKWLIPHPLGFDDNKVFKKQLGILTSVQAYMIISLRTYEEMIEESESEDQTQALNITFEDSSFEEVNSEESHTMVT